MIAFFITSALLGIGLAMDAFSVSVANAMRDPSMKRGEMVRIAGAFALFQFLMPEIGWICVHTLLTYFESFQACIPWIALILLVYIGGKMLLEGIRDRRAMHGVVEQAKNVSEFSENGGECRSFQAKEKRDRKARGFQAEEKRDEEERGFQVKENRGGEGQDFQEKEKRGGEDTAWQIERAGNKYGAKVLPIRTLILQAIATSIDALSVGFAIAEYSVTEALIAGAIIAAVTFCICIGGLLIGKKTGDLLGWRASIFGGIILIGIGIEIWAGGMF